MIPYTSKLVNSKIQTHAPMSGRGELRTFSSSKAKTENEIVMELLQNPDLSVDVLCLQSRAIDCAVGNRAYRIRSA